MSLQVQEQGRQWAVYVWPKGQAHGSQPGWTEALQNLRLSKRDHVLNSLSIKSFSSMPLSKCTLHLSGQRVLNNVMVQRCLLSGQCCAMWTVLSMLYATAHEGLVVDDGVPALSLFNVT